MRRREKFVLVSLLLSFGLLIVQQIPLEWRYLGVAIFGVVTYLFAAWALSEDLDRLEWITALPLPTMYAVSVGLFYYLLPTGLGSRILVLALFGIGMYALLLTENIFTVAKGRTIQLIYAAHTIGLLFTLLISLFLTNTLLSLRLTFYLNGIIIGLIHFPLILMYLWSVKLLESLSIDLLEYAVLIDVLFIEFAIAISFIPFPVWHSSIFIMALLYIILSVMHSFLRGRLFKKAAGEFILVTVFVIILFFWLVPLK